MSIKLVQDLGYHPLNSEIYSLSSLDDLISSIEEFGLLQPLVINQRNEEDTQTVKQAGVREHHPP